MNAGGGSLTPGGGGITDQLIVFEPAVNGATGTAMR